MIDSDAITWNAPDGDHPARRAAQRSYAGAATGSFEKWMEAYADDAVIEDPVGKSPFDPEGKGHHGKAEIRKFWEAAIQPLKSMHFTINESHASGNSVANVGTITTKFPDGGVIDTDLVMVYTVNDEGLVSSMRAYWELERAMATYRKES